MFAFSGSPSPEKEWYPVLLVNERSVDRLNTLLFNGWCFPDTTIDPYPIYQVPKRAVPDFCGRYFNDLLDPGTSYVTLVLLQRGREDRVLQQVAEASLVNAEGYENLVKTEELVRSIADEWERFLVFPISPTIQITVLRRL